MYKKIGIYSDILHARLISQIAKVDKKSRKSFPDSRKDTQDNQIRIVFLKKDFVFCYCLKEFFTDPKIQVINILFDMINILLSESFFEYFEKVLMLQIIGNIFVDGFDKLLV
jgi:hypothetical protein